MFELLAHGASLVGTVWRANPATINRVIVVAARGDAVVITTLGRAAAAVDKFMCHVDPPLYIAPPAACNRYTVSGARSLSHFLIATSSLSVHTCAASGRPTAPIDCNGECDCSVLEPYVTVHVAAKIIKTFETF